ncbi:MAG: hypothetical protein Q9204_001112 [Flavoplaca sp. TL-2023a]
MAPTRKVIWAIALPCLILAVLGALQYLPNRQHGITANLVQRDTNNIPIPTTPLTDLRQHWSQQNLENAPALPIIGLSELYIESVVNNTFPDFPPLLNLNTTFSSNSTPRVQQRSNGHTQKHARFHVDTSPAVLNPLLKRGEAEPCDVGSPCADKSWDFYSSSTSSALANLGQLLRRQQKVRLWTRLLRRKKLHL